MFKPTQSQGADGVDKEVLESYCWMYSTWNIPKEYKGACSGGDQVSHWTAVHCTALHCTVLQIMIGLEAPI